MRMIRLLLAAAVLVGLAATPAAAASEPVSSEITFRGDGGIVLHGTVLTPAGAPDRHPGMVLVHGAGEGTPRTKLMGEAVAFARTGMSVLVYDKRSAGYSVFHRDYGQLARDALGAVAALRAQPGVDPAKVGLWGLSEGGWVAPLAASQSSQVAFVVTVGGNVLEPLRQQTWATAAGLRKAGVSGSLVDRTEPNLYRVIADGGLFPEPWYSPGPVLERVKQPVLAIWGADDLLTPPQETPPLFAAALERGGNRHYTLRYVPDADHAAHQSPDHGVTRLPALAPGYAQLVGDWVRSVSDGRLPTAQAPDPLPKQASLSVPVPRPAWWESAVVQLAVLVLLIVAFAGYPVVALVRRVRGRVRPAVGRSPRLLAAAGLATVAGFFGYLFPVLMGGAKLASPGPLLAGRPVVWLAMQALAVTVVIATVLTWAIRRRSDTSGERVRLTLLAVGGTAFVPWALYWGLLLP